MKAIDLPILATVMVILLLGCPTPVSTNNPAPSPLNLSRPGTVLQQIGLATVAVPATANGGRSASSRSAAPRTLFTPATDETVIQGSELVQALANASVNITEVFLTGLKTSPTATANDLAVGEVVSVGAITLVMGGSPNAIADAGRLTTRLSADGSELQYFWNLGTQMGATADIWFVLNVFADGSLELYAQVTETSYMKCTSSAAGLVQYAQYGSGNVSAMLTDTRQSGSLRSASLNPTFQTLLSATPTNAALLTLQHLDGSEGGPWYAFEAYDGDGNLLVTAGGSHADSGIDTVELAGQTYTHGKSYLLKALTPTDGYSWARVENGIWYTWPQPAPSKAWSGGSTDGSGTAVEVPLPNYDLWLESPSSSDPDNLDGEDVTLAGLSRGTELSYNTVISAYQGALVQSMSAQDVLDTGHLAVSTVAANTFSAAWNRVVADLADFSTFSASEFLADLPTVMADAADWMPSASQ